MPIEDEILHVPNYLPLRDYQIQDKYHTVDLGAGKNYKRLRLDEKSFQALKMFLKPNTPKDVAQSVGIPIDDAVKFCHSLKKERLLVPYEAMPSSYDRYSRHLQYYGLCGLNPAASQKKLSNLKITLIGAGGIGNWVGLNLIGLGVKKLRLIDPDIIEESNLPRQVLFSETDLGKFKVETAAREFKKKNKNLSIETIKEDATSSNIFDFVSGSDFVVLSADKPFFKIQKWTNEACVKYRIPLLNVGYAAEEGVMGPLVVPGISSCMACNNNLIENNYHVKKNSNDNPFMKHFIAPSFVCLNSLISCMASYEIVKYFLEIGECISLNHLIRVDPLAFSINKISNNKDPKCKACSHIS